MRLTDFKVLTFDCYGTLIDWESGMVEALKPLTSTMDRPLTRNEILEAHARHESSQQRQTPSMLYRDLLSVVYKRLAEEWGVPASHEQCVAYGRSVRNWPAFPDSADALQYLKKHYKLAILSNVDNETFSHSNRRLQVEFDAIFTAEDIGSYKPSLRNFEYMLEKLQGMGLAKYRYPSYGGKSVPRSQAGQRYGACVMLDLPAQAGDGLRSHDGSRRNARITTFSSRAWPNWQRRIGSKSADAKAGNAIDP